MASKEKFGPGTIFWAESEGIGQEDQGRHPWVVISNPQVETDGEIVIAVPMTTNGTRYAEFDKNVFPADIERIEGVKYALQGTDGTIKCAKLRHWSVERIDEVIGHLTPAVLETVRRLAAMAVEAPRRKRKK